MNSENLKSLNRLRRQLRVRARIFGNAKVPRLSVFRSNRNIFAQLIDDDKGETVASYSSKKIGKKDINKTNQAFEVGKSLGEKALKVGIKQVFFDRGSYHYHGRVKAVAEGVKSAGVKI